MDWSQLKGQSPSLMRMTKGFPEIVAVTNLETPKDNLAF
jgi:hypothetical protein